MDISIYSVIISVVFFNLALVAAFIMRRSSALLARQTIPFLLFTVFLGVVRLLTPVDIIGKTFIVRSYHFAPALVDFVRSPVIGNYTVGALLLTIWLFGTVVFILRDLVRHVRSLRASRNYPPADRDDLLDLASDFGGNFGLLVSPVVSRPYVSGLFRPIIYLPDIELPEEQWRVILRHEVQHIRSRDGWKKLFFLAIQALFWWNPLAHISLKEIDTLIELQCDARVTAGMGAEEVNRYLETLKELKTRTPPPQVPAAASALVWDQKQMDARLEALQNVGLGKKRRPNVFAYILLVTVFVLSYFVIVQPIVYPDSLDLTEKIRQSDEVFALPYMLETSETSNEYIVHKNGEYHFYINDQHMSRITEEQLLMEPFKSMPIVEEDK